MLVQKSWQNQYFGGKITVAPKGKETLTFLKFCGFFYDCSTITLVQDGWQHQYIHSA
jgi:hypothetical protein